MTMTNNIFEDENKEFDLTVNNSELNIGIRSQEQYDKRAHLSYQNMKLDLLLPSLELRIINQKSNVK